MLRFPALVSVEGGEAAIGGAVGVAHQKHALGVVQADRHAHLFEDEVALEVIARGGQGFRAAGYDDHVRPCDALTLEKLVGGQTDALIETAEHSGIGLVRLWRRIEVEDFFHSASYQLSALSHQANRECPMS